MPTLTFTLPDGQTRRVVTDNVPSQADIEEIGSHFAPSNSPASTASTAPAATTTTTTATSTPFGEGYYGRAFAEQSMHVPPMFPPGSDIPRMLGAVAVPAAMTLARLTPAGRLASTLALLGGAAAGGVAGEALGGDGNLGPAAVKSAAGELGGQALGTLGPPIAGYGISAAQGLARTLARPGRLAYTMLGGLTGHPIEGYMLERLFNAFGTNPVLRAIAAASRTVPFPAPPGVVAGEQAVEALAGQAAVGRARQRAPQ